MFSFYFYIITYHFYLIKSEYPINDLDFYKSKITNITSDYIYSININNENCFFANNSQYSLSKNGLIEYIQEFKKLDEFSNVLYDSENNIFYYVCTDQYLVIGSNNNYYDYNHSHIVKKPSEKCSITKMNDIDSEFYLIITGTKIVNSLFSLVCKKKLFFIKLNKNLQLVKYFSLTTEYCSSSSENEFSSCLSLYNNSLILCVYRFNVLIGGVINSYFSDFINYEYIHGEYNNLINFFFFLFNDETSILISRNGVTNNYYITTIKILIDNDYHLERKNITSFISDLDLNNIGVTIYNKGIFIGTIYNEYIYIYQINLETNMKYIIKIENNDIINQISLTYFNDGYLGIFFRQLINPINNFNNISYSIFLYPEPINCNPEYLTAISQEEINIDISKIFPNYTNAYLENNYFNFQFIDKNISGTALNNGKYRINIYYLYKNQDKKIFFIDEKCYIIYQVCNEGCDYCNIFSNDPNETLCINCTTSYAPLINNESQCVKNTQNISLYYYSANDNKFNYCYENCLYCHQEGNIFENNCDVCLNESFRKSYIKKGQCVLCENDNNNLFYYSNDEVERIICLDDSITKCPENYPYLIKNNNECTSYCPSSFPILLNYECLNECPYEKGYIEYYYNKCICSSKYYYYYDINDNNNLICILNEKCPNKYPNLNILTGECKKNEEGKDIIFNNETIDECPIYTKQIDKGNYYTCSCINPYYTINEKIYCSSTSLCNENKNGYILLIKEENLCVKECNINYPIKFEYYCLNKCPIGYTIYNNNCIIISGFNTTEDVEIEIYDDFTIMKGQTFIAQTYDTSIKSITNANSYNGNLSTIDFGECINKLKEKNNIPSNENLIIIKIDINREDSVTNQVEYSILTQNGIKLDLSVCSGIDIKIENTVKISSEELDLNKALEVFEYGYDMYNSKDSFYHSICTVFTNGNGTDVPLENRKSDYFKNISFCEEGCEYFGFNLTTLRVKCSCEIKTSISNNENNFSFQSLSSEFTSIISNSNIKVFICFKNTFSKYLVSNCAFWFILFCVICEILCLIMYCFTRFDPIFLKIKKAKEFYALEKILQTDGKINKYIQNKEDFYENNEIKDNSNNKIINSPENPPKKKQSENIISEKILSEKSINENSDKNLESPISNKKLINSLERKHTHYEKNLKHYLEEKFKGNKEINNSNLKNSNSKFQLLNQFNKKKKRKKIHFYEKDKPGSDLNGNEIKIYSSRLKIMKTNNFDKESLNSIKTNKESVGDELIIFPHTDEQLNRLNYSHALIYDRRNFFSIYIGFIKYSQLIIFTFITNSDYNLKYIKICLFIFSFIGYFFFNTLFFSDKTMSKIYKSKGKYQFIYSLPKTIFSSICCILINMLLKFISLSNKQIIRLTKEKNAKKEEKILFEIIKSLKIKLIIFFILIFLFSIIFWYYVTAFCSVYINTQKHLITNTIISFGESMLYPFGICLITTILRKISLRYKIKFVFIISKIFEKL